MPPLPLLDPTDGVVASISAGDTSRLRRRPAVVLRGSPTDRVTIYCGAEDPLTSGDIFESEHDEYRPWSVQILPEYTPPPPPRTKYPITRSNGCGAPVHYAARAVRRGQRWYGWKEHLEPTVVPLDNIYFSSDTTKSLGLTNGEAECGCSTSGIGCAICGNPLGARIIRCATHSIHAINPADRDVYTFLPTAVSPAASSNADALTPETREHPTRRASLPLPAFPTPIARPPPPPNSIPFFPASTSDSAFASVAPVFYVDPTPTPGARHPWSIPSMPTPTVLPSPTTPVFESAPPITPTAAQPGLPSALSAPPAQQITPIPAPAPPRPAPRRRRTLRRAVSVERYFSGGAAELGADAGAVGVNAAVPSPSPSANANADTAGSTEGPSAMDLILRHQVSSTTPSSWDADVDAAVAQAAADLWGGGGGEDSATAYNAAIGAPGGGRWQLWPAWVDDAAHAYSTTGAWPEGGAEQTQGQRGAEGSSNADAGGRGGFYLPVLPLTGEDLDMGSVIAVDPDALRFASPSADRVSMTMETDAERGIVFPDSPVQDFRVETRLADAPEMPRRVFPAFAAPSIQDVPVPSLAEMRSFLDDTRSPGPRGDSDSAPPTPTPVPRPTVTVTASARVRDIERHLDALGVRVAALDAAAADVRQHIESLRPAAVAVRASVRAPARSPVRSPAREVGFGVWAEMVREEDQSGARVAALDAAAAADVRQHVESLRPAALAVRASSVRTRARSPVRSPAREVEFGVWAEMVREEDQSGARVAALDAAAAADVRQHVESLRPAALAVRASSVRTRARSPVRSPAREMEVGVWAARVREEAQSAVLETTPGIDVSTAVATPPTDDTPHPESRTELVSSTRAAIAEERARLGELQARLTSLTAPPPPALTVTSPPAADPLSTAPLITDMRTLVREQTDLLARVGGLVAEMGARVGALEGVAGPTAGGASRENGTGSGGVASALARARATLERADRAMRAPWATFTQVQEWAAEREEPTWEELMRVPWNPPSMAAAEVDSEVQRSAGASIPPPPPPVANASHGDRAPGGEDDKRPRRRMFFDR
ncbi:hypothetical protein B0H11DRAFT_2285352 [Mycena galericulata]|nr:hypothetical protein B0H11DRAFT_2285352 [Mycena galericulata]